MKTSFINRLRSLFKSVKALVLYTFFDNEDQALVEFEKCLHLYPEDGHTLRILREILIKKGMYLQGIEKLNQALQYISERGKSDPGIFAYLAYGYAELNKLDESILFYRKAINSWSKDRDFFTKTDLFYNLGRVYLQKRHFVEAKDTYILGLDLNNTEARLHFGIGIAYYELGQYENAFDHLETAIELDPTFQNDKTMKKLRNELKSKLTVH